MPTVDVWNLKKEKVGSLNLLDEVFGQALREDLISDVVRNQQARMRKGTASTKTRGDVSGTGKKPYRQKRTGRARQGTLRGPHQVGGGVAFGPKLRSYKYRLPKKVRRQALRSWLSNQLKEQKLLVVKDFELSEIKTKSLMEVLNNFGLKKALLVDRKDNNNLKLSVRNLPRFSFCSPEGLTLVEMMRYENIMISESTIKQLEGELKP